MARQKNIRFDRQSESYAKWKLRLRRVAVEFRDPLLCLVCVYSGVLMTTNAVMPSIARALLSMPPYTEQIISPLAALPITLVVCRRRAFKEWRDLSQTSVGERVLTAIASGVTWGL